jgi:hypothetical protein
VACSVKRDGVRRGDTGTDAKSVEAAATSQFGDVKAAMDVRDAVGGDMAVAYVVVAVATAAAADGPGAGEICSVCPIPTTSCSARDSAFGGWRFCNSLSRVLFNEGSGISCVVCFSLVQAANAAA